MLHLHLEHLITQIRPYFSVVILKRGWGYFTDCAVTQLQTEGETVIRATVEGSKRYRVRIDLQSFPASSCTCPYEGYCKHMAAVLFEALDTAELSPRDFLYPPQTEASLQEIKTKKSAVIPAPQESDTVSEWHAYFGEKLGNSKYDGLQSIQVFYANVQDHLPSLCENWNPLIQRLYRLHVWLFMMKQVDVISSQIGSTYSTLHFDTFAYFKVQTQSWVKEFYELIREIDSKNAKEQYPQQLVETIDFLTQHAFPVKETVTDWVFVYRLLWSSLLDDEEWITKERLWLQAELEKLTHSLHRKDTLVMALMHFDIMDHHDRKAMEMAEMKLTTLNPDNFLGYLSTFQSVNQWGRLVDWLKWMLPMFKRSGRRYLSTYNYYWQEALQHQDVEKDWIEATLFLLPLSYGYYTEFLIQQGRYQEWVDLNLYCGNSPLDVVSAHLKEVESQNVRYLLPLYHHAVERYILEKNRDSYKKATRMLKKLKQYYRRLKDQHRWESYMNDLSNKYTRLRALQEELQKGKLIG